MEEYLLEGLKEGKKMKIDLVRIPVRAIYNGYVDSAEDGVIAYGGKLNVRPAYQREFIYKDKQRDEVIKTIRKGFPLNVMYWIKGENDGYELMDGQQRTISFCQYVNGDFSLDYQFFHNLTQEEQEQILNYELMIYICEGTDKEKLDWFEVINIAGEKLTQQEIRNALYTGEWLTSAKKYFSKTNCPAYGAYSDYMKGSPIRQEYLETVLRWICDKEGIEEIRQYMSIHQHDSNANKLWLYYQNVMEWVKATFTSYRKEMKGIEWGIYYNLYGDKDYNTTELESRIVELMADDDVSRKAGIYEYLLDGQEKHLSIRAFSPAMKRSAYTRQQGICANCHKHYTIDEMEADHITPWHLGGPTTADNCQMLCKDCNRHKSGK